MTEIEKKNLRVGSIIMDKWHIMSGMIIKIAPYSIWVPNTEEIIKKKLDENGKSIKGTNYYVYWFKNSWTTLHGSTTIGKFELISL